MVSAETLFSFPDWTITFVVHTDASDKQSGAVISQNNKPIELQSRIIIKTQCNYTTTENQLLVIVEFLKKFHGILFGYEINLFLYHKSLVYASTLSESQRVMQWRLIIENSGPNIQHISVVDNIVADTISRLLSTSVDKYDPNTSKSQCCANKLFSIFR